MISTAHKRCRKNGSGKGSCQIDWECAFRGITVIQKGITRVDSYFPSVKFSEILRVYQTLPECVSLLHSPKIYTVKNISMLHLQMLYTPETMFKGPFQTKAFYDLQIKDSPGVKALNVK